MGLTENVAEISLIAENGRLASGLRLGLRMVKDFASGASEHLKKMSLAPKDPAKGQGWASHAMGQIAGSVAMRGIDMMIEQGKKVMDFNKDLTRFGIAARKSGADLASVGAAAREVSNETGLDAQEVLRGTRAYVDMAGAMSYSKEKMSLLARTSQATAADIGDLTQVVFQMQRNMKISDAELEDSLGGVINMSKDGAVHFAQMAQEIAELAPQAARYGMVGRAGINELTALMQVARTGFGSVSEMGTGITRVFTGLTMHASKFRKYGVEVFNTAKDGTKTWRKFSDIFNDIRTNNILSKDPELLRKAFGRSEADRTIRLWMEGVSELRTLEEAGRANGVVQQDLGTYAASAAGRMDIAFAKMKNAFAEALTPERVDQIVSGITSIANSMGPLMTAVGRVSDAFAGFVHLIAKTKQHLQGDSHYLKSGGGSEEETRIAEAYDNLAARGMLYRMPADVQERAKKIKKHANDYDQAMDEIMGAEDDWGPTDESIKRALRASRSHDMSPEGMAHTEAGRSYLISRDKEISAERYKRLRGEVDKEYAAANPAAETMRRYREIEESDKRRAEAQAAYVREHVTPVIKELGNHLGDIITKAIQTKPTQVNIDGNPVATASSNATNRRRQ